MAKIKTRVLSIDPGTRYMGFAAFEGTELVDYGTREIRQGSVDTVLSHVQEIVARLVREKTPDYLAMERCRFSQATSNIRMVMAADQIMGAAKRHGVKTYEFHHRTTRKEICGDGNATKKRAAQTLIIYYPELKVYLKTGRKSVLDYHMHMFDAVAVGVTFVRRHIDSASPIRK